MKVRKLLEIQSKFEEAVIPSDMNDDKLEEHFSNSKEDWISILDMDLIHLVRAYSKCIRSNNLTNKINDNHEHYLGGIEMITNDVINLVKKELEILLLLNLA